MSQIVVCGEALLDVFAGADTPAGIALEARVGGSPFNVAVGLARLGRAVAFMGAVSSGFLGERLMRALTQEGVDTTTVERVDAPTTLSLVGLDAAGVPSYSFYGENAADRQLGAAGSPRLPAGAGTLHVGSFAMVVEPIASALRSLVERERGRVLVSYDPNVRLAVVPDLDRWREVLEWMLSRAHVLKISEEDLGLLYPELSTVRFIDRAIACGVRLAVVTHGAAGASAGTASSRVAVPASAAALVDTVGAGDSFQAALLAWLAENGALSADQVGCSSGQQLAAALRFACVAAGLTCSRRGADLPTRHDVGESL